MTFSASLKERRVAERPHHCEAFCAPSDVEDAPARHDQEEERKTCVTELQCESRYRAENLRHSNHSALVENHNCTVWEGARGRGENVNQGTACLRQHRGAADGGTACTSPPTYDSSALQRDRGQESRELNRQQTNRSSVVQPMRHCYTRGSPTAKLKSRKQQNSCLPQAGTNKRKGFNHQYCREPWRWWDTEDPMPLRWSHWQTIIKKIPKCGWFMFKSDLCHFSKVKRLIGNGRFLWYLKCSVDR